MSYRQTGMMTGADNRKQAIMKSSAPKKIAKIQFGAMTSEEIKLASEVQVSNREVFQMPLRNAAPFGCMDPRLGISDKAAFCKTCNKKLTDCAGHFGFIQLELPVFHAGYFRHTLVILQCICKGCSRILLSLEDRVLYLKKLKDPRIDALIRGAIFKKVVELCKRASKCPHCAYSNGVVKKVGGACFKIVHEKYRAKSADEQTENYHRDMKEVLKQYPELKQYAMKEVELLTPMRAWEVLRKVTEEDAILLWMQMRNGQPDSLVMWTVPVPPVPIRPSVQQESGGGSTEDDLTVKLQEIIEMNSALKMALDRGATMKMVAEDWEFLQIQVALFINGETPGIPRQWLGNKTIRGLCQRLKGKQGRFRGNLSGKRVDFSGRTVISPDPNLRVDQVGVPVLVAKVMTYPERVNRYNIDKMRKLVLNGPEVHPGANMVRSGPRVSALQYADRAGVAANLQIGDIVERHMNDGDVVLFNRQPSLHKMSIMSHNVKVFPWRTFRFNECACTPYNADFDGDEMNLHLPQTEEARAEAANLMNITNNLVTPRNGEPLVAATQDFLTGAYLLTQKDVFLNKADFCRFVTYLSDGREQIDMPPPAIYKPRMMWTGKQVISLLIRPRKNVENPCTVNVESEERYYTQDEHFCVNDGYVVFREGDLICGTLGKKTLGGESKSGLFYVLIRDFGAAEATRCMSRLAKLCARFLGDRGFSIGIDDVTPSVKMASIKAGILSKGQEQAEELITAYKSGKIKLKPGCDALQSLESDVNGILGKIRENIGKEALVALHRRNAPLNMAQCGSKGSALNISQMIACLGQQSVGGQRIQNGFVNRTLPHFPAGALYPAAKGFVSNSFFSGLTATEFFFHTMGGREGLVDTAVKTAETGYMARRLMKALEDLSMQYDMTVRNSEQTVVQFTYGDDGLNPQVMEKSDRPVNFSRLTMNQRAQVPDSKIFGKYRQMHKQQSFSHSTSDALKSIVGKMHHTDSSSSTSEPTLSSQEINLFVEKELAGDHFQDLLPNGAQFIEETREYFAKFANEVRSLEELESKAISESSIAVVEAGTTATVEEKPKRGSRGATKAVKTESIASSSSSSSVANSDAGAHLKTAGQVREWLRSLTVEQRTAWAAQSSLAGTQAFRHVHLLLRDNTVRLTATQLANTMNKALRKYVASTVEPGEAVGAVGAQSLSEPGTQMTLKTFHFAGVASMNVTLGVPRLKEIINASSTISTPIIEARIVQDNSVSAARVAKAQIEKTMLGEVCQYIKEVHRPDASYVSIKLDAEAIQRLHLNVSAESVRHAILHSQGAGTRPAVLRALKDKHIVVVGGENLRLKVFPPEMKENAKAANASLANGSTSLQASQKIYFAVQALKQALPDVIVQGIPSVSRAIINEEMDENTGKKVYYLLVEGYGVADVMGCPGVDGRQTKSNHILEMQRVLGIEAARGMIAAEIKYIMTAYGITVDRRHLMLLSDVMSFKGEILGITRFGVARMKESVLMLASFEKTTDHLFDAAVHSREDSIVGVSECIIMGVPIPIGTGIFKLIHNSSAAQQTPANAALESPAATTTTASEQKSGPAAKNGKKGGVEGTAVEEEVAVAMPAPGSHVLGRKVVAYTPSVPQRRVRLLDRV